MRKESDMSVLDIRPNADIQYLNAQQLSATELNEVSLSGNGMAYLKRSDAAPFAILSIEKS